MRCEKWEDSDARRISLFCFLACSLSAQHAIKNLAPNGDGSALYFSSAFRQKQSEQYAHDKIFVWQEGLGVRLFEQRPVSVHLRPDAALQQSSTAYNLVAASISSDATTVAITGRYYCQGTSLCSHTFGGYEGEVRRSGAPALTLKGTAAGSPNGRFALFGWAGEFPFPPAPVTLVDLTSGRRTSVLTHSRPPYRHAVANDGTILLSQPGTLCAAGPPVKSGL